MKPYTIVIKGKTYTLHQLKRNPNLRYFSAKRSLKGRPIPIPKGYRVIHNKRTGLPMIKRGR